MDSYTYEYKGNLYVNLTNRCVCDCIFCDKKVLQQAVRNNLVLEKEPSAKEVLAEIRTRLASRAYDELVFCGVGDPLIKLDVLLSVLRGVRASSRIRTRLNTTGHAGSIFSGRDVAGELKVAGLDTINVSLNATDAQEYERVCRPSFKGSYGKVIDFVKDCRERGIDTIISFVEGHADGKKAKALAKELGVRARIREKI